MVDLVKDDVTRDVDDGNQVEKLLDAKGNPLETGKIPEKDNREEVEYTEEEKRALDKGWKPEEEYDGPPGSWRSAREYNDRGDLIQKIMAQGRQLDELRQAVVFMSEAKKKEFFAGYQRAIEDTKARRDYALEEGDFKSAQLLSDKLVDLKDQFKDARGNVAPQVQSQRVQPTQTYINWSAKNDWYTKDKVLTKFAEAIGVDFKEENPTSTEQEMLSHVEHLVKKEFPHKFAAAPNPDSGGRGNSRGNNSGSGSSLSKIESNMTEVERTIMKTILKSTPKLTKEQYLKEYASS